MSSIKKEQKNFKLLDIKNQLLTCIKQDHIEAQNILMKISDREIALSMLYMDQNEETIIFSILSAQKNKRIKEELFYQKNLKINYKLYCDITENLLKKFKKHKNNKNQKTYIRPQIYKK